MEKGEFRVKNVVNNNIVIVRDNQGHEMVAIGKGLGFRKRKFDRVLDSEVMKTYLLVGKNNMNIFTFFDEVPFEVVETAQSIIDYAVSKLNMTFNVNLLIALADHINFSIQQYKEGNTTPKLLSEEVKRFYIEEYEVGRHAIVLIRERLGIELPEDEATSIAFHLVTASQNNSNSEARKLMVSIKEIVDITSESLGIELDSSSLAYSRFIIHLKFFLRRVLSASADSQNLDLSSIFAQIQTSYGQVENCVLRISEYIKNKFNYQSTDEDNIYLMIHLARLYENERKGRL